MTVTVSIKDEDLLRKAQAFLKDCRGQRVHIIHDYDVDGISGGLILLHALKRLGAETTASTRQGRGQSLAHEELSIIKERFSPERIIITDQDPRSFDHQQSLKDTFPQTPVMIIDHHFVQEYDDILFIHPLTLYGIDGSLYPSAKLVHDLCLSVVDATDLAWLACLGILGDAGTKQHRAFLEETAEKEGFVMLPDAYDSEFAKISEAIECCSCASEEELLGYVEALKDAESFAEALALDNPCQYVREEVDEYLARGLDLAETHGAVTFIPIKSAYGIAGWVTTLLSFKNPERVLIGYREQVDSIGLSARHQAAKVHLGTILKELCEELGGRGGGHAPAAGGSIPKERFEEFKKAFSERVNESLEPKQHS